MSNNEKILLERAYTDGKTKCGCGHTQAMLPSTDSCICSYCGHKIYNKSIAHFRFKYYKAKEEMEK